MLNPLTCMDFYKSDHRRQYPEGTTLVYSNLTARSSKLSNIPKHLFENKIVFFGLQYFIKHFLIDSWNNQFFHKPKENVVDKYKRRMDNSLGKDTISTEHIEALHDLGYLPICIKALPEGALVPIKVPCLTIYNTHPDFFWLTNYLETVLSCYLWKPITSATVSYHYKKLLRKYSEETGANLDFVKFQGHDFSFRGMSGPEDAALSGAGHLTSFVGTDTIPAIDLIEDYYGGDAEKELIGCSVPSTEHSCMSMGTKENEIDTYRRLITRLYPKGTVSIVSDTWDFWQVVTEYTKVLKEEILNRDGKVVIRGDSGDPVRIIAGDETKEISEDWITTLKEAANYVKERIVEKVADETPHGIYGKSDVNDFFKYQGKTYKIDIDIEWNRYDKKFYYIDGSKIKSVEEVELTPEQKGAVECLWEIFGGTITTQGFKTLDSHIGLIYGDSITLERAKAILEGLKKKGFSSDNIVFGVGSFCVGPETPILCSDLIWRKAKELKVGQEIIAFDENPKFGDNKHAARRYILGTIKSNEIKQKECSRVTTNNGESLIVSNDHPWLVFVNNRNKTNLYLNSSGILNNKINYPRTPGLAWKKTSELKLGDQLVFLAKPWVAEDTYSGGWLAGMYDGEGCISKCTGDDRIPSWKINISQNKGLVMDRIHYELKKRNFAFYEAIRKCPQLVIKGGWPETLRFLGVIRPTRLLEKFKKVIQDMPSLSRNRTYSLDAVSHIESIGTHDVSSIETSCGTFITGGFLTHNTYQFVTRDTFGFAVKSTYGEVNGEGREIFKDPVTDNGIKKSARGLLQVILENGEYKLNDRVSWEEEKRGCLETVFLDGKLVRTTTISEIRERLN